MLDEFCILFAVPLPLLNMMFQYKDKESVIESNLVDWLKRGEKKES